MDAVKNPKLQEEISSYIEKNFNVNVDEVRLRPLGSAISAQVHVALDHSMTLDNLHALLTKIRESVVKEFETEETIIIPRPVFTNSGESDHKYQSP